MPARSQSQYRYIEALRKKHGSPEATPDADKWVWEGDVGEWVSWNMSRVN